MRSRNITLISIALACLGSPALSVALPWSDDFDDPMDEAWDFVHGGLEGIWSWERGEIWQRSLDRTPKPPNGRSFAIVHDLAFEDLTLDVRLRHYGEGVEEMVGVVFGYQDPNNYYSYGYRREWTGEPSVRLLEAVVNGTRMVLAEDDFSHEFVSQFPPIRITRKGKRIAVWHNSYRVFDVTDNTFGIGSVGLLAQGKGKFSWDEFSVDEAQTIDDSPFHIHPYLQNVAQASVKIMWETNGDHKALVEYGEPGILGKRAAPTRNASIFTAVMTGLEAGRVYEYKLLVDGLTTIGPYRFRTAPEGNQPFRFAVWGDSRSNPESHKKVVNEILRHTPHLAIHTGDIVSDGNNYDEWKREFFDPARDLLVRTPFSVSIGNHEKDAPWFYRYMDNPGFENYFSFNYGNVHFVSLDTNQRCGPRSAQAEWLETDLQSASARKAHWIVAFFHHPPFSAGWDDPAYDGDLGPRLGIVPILEKYRVDLAFMGHTHDYERYEHGGVWYVITGGGGSALDHFEQPWEFVESYAALHHCTVVDVHGESVEMAVFDTEGKQIDGLELTKAKQEHE